MPRYVIQHHTLPDGDEHWDLMLEVADQLWTWSLPVAPSGRGVLPVCALALPPHRTAYLEYEGEVSADRGSVAIYDRGTYQWTTDPPATADPALAEWLEFELCGDQLTGRFQLELTPHEGRDIWRLRQR